LMGYPGDVNQLWKLLVADEPDQLVKLHHIDFHTAEQLSKLQNVIRKNYEKAEHAFLNDRGSGWVKDLTVTEFRATILKLVTLADLGPDRHLDADVLFAALDLNQGGTISLDEVEWLDKWRGIQIASRKADPSFWGLGKKCRDRQDKLKHESDITSTRAQRIRDIQDMRLMSTLGNASQARSQVAKPGGGQDRLKRHRKANLIATRDSALIDLDINFATLPSQSLKFAPRVPEKQQSARGPPRSKADTARGSRMQGLAQWTLTPRAQFWSGDTKKSTGKSGTATPAATGDPTGV